MNCSHSLVFCRIRLEFLPAALALLLSGCGGVGTSADGLPRPGIDERSSALRQPETPFRTVAAGDTLYSIAWESGRDYRTLAAWNRISPPYTIKIGQQIRIVPPDEKIAESENREIDSEKKISPTRSGGQQKAPGQPLPKTKGTKAAPPPGATTKPGVVSNSPKSKGTLGGKNKAAGKNSASKKNGPALDWSWPADGMLLNRTGDGKPKGLDIAGSRGSVIRAAATGRVVYQGSGLRGYGQLIIIKHNDEFLSAYAHNDRIYVKEGDLVKRGEKIADMGSSGTDRTKLHFEIRRQGVPADPLTYLPKR